MQSKQDGDSPNISWNIKEIAILDMIPSPGGLKENESTENSLVFDSLKWSRDNKGGP